MFDYKCNSCGHKFDKLVPFSESEKIVERPKCKKHDSNKLLCAPNISNGGSDSRREVGSRSRSRSHIVVVVVVVFVVVVVVVVV